ncbi:hypothetical protein ACQ4PT_056815 [Festuca glaucescens]
MEEVFTRCRVRRWRLLIQKGQNGEVIRALAVKEAVAIAMCKSASGGSLTPDRPVIVMTKDHRTSKKMLVAMSREEVNLLPRRQQPLQSTEMLSAEELQVMRLDFEWELEDCGRTFGATSVTAAPPLSFSAAPHAAERFRSSQHFLKESGLALLQSQQLQGNAPSAQQQIPTQSLAVQATPQSQQEAVPLQQQQGPAPQAQGLSKNQIRNQKKAKVAAEVALKLKEKEGQKGKDSYVDMVFHKEDTCPVKKNPPLAAKFFGGTNPNLEFFQVELADANVQQIGVNNIGIVYIEAGEKYYRIGIVTELPGEVNGDGDDPADPSDNGTEDANGTQGKNDMDTDQGASAKPPPSGSSSASKNTVPKSSNSTHKKTAATQNSPASGADCPMSDVLPVHLEKARDDILSWLNTDNPDETKCYNLLREMELVNDEGYYSYVQDMEQSIATTDLLQPTEFTETNLPTEAPKRKQAWGPVHGTRQCARLQGNAGKTILELAQDIKKKNLEVPSFQGLVANHEINKEVETDFQSRYAGEDGSVLSACFGDSADTRRPSMDMTMVPVTLASFTSGPGLFMFGSPSPGTPVAGHLGMSASTTPSWHANWAQLHHQKNLLLPADVTRAKLHQMCEEFALRR